MARLTPADIRKVKFRKPPLGKRGYDEEEVDKFLELVEQTIAALEAEASGPGARIPAPRLHDPADSYGTSRAAQSAMLAELDQIKVRLARIEAAVTDRGGRRPAGEPVFGAAPRPPL